MAKSMKSQPTVKPEPAERAGYEQVVAVLTRAVRRLYRLRRTRAFAADAAGLALGVPVHHVALQPADVLSTEGLRCRHEQGQCPLEVILGLAYQLGVCAGYQMRDEEVRTLEQLVRHLWDKKE